ncbi:MAG: C4-type zinc ribbon domain-containing protein [Verrucomicrobiota bacterium]
MDPKKLNSQLIELNSLQDTIDSLGPRSKKRQEAESQAAKILEEMPQFIKSHHQRIRKLGRRSVAEVRNWVCQSCFISVPVGARSALARGTDLSVCESCGAYLYMPEGELEQAVENQKTTKKRATAK